MKKFSEFGIKASQESFVGDKIKASRILNKEIAVHNYRIEDSKFTGKCLHLQISLDGEKRVVFTGSKSLMEMIGMVEKGDFPFNATIAKEDERYIFV